MKQLIIILLLACFHGYAQVTPPNPKYTRPQLQEDISLIKKVIQEAHPGYGRFNDQAEIDQALDKLSRSLPDSMSLEDFFRASNPVIALLNCGHTKYHPAFSTMRNYPYYFNPGKVIPLHIRIIEGRAYAIWTDRNQLPAGSEIIKINNQPVNEILRVLRANQFADGRVASSKDRDIETAFAALFANFIGRSASFSLEYSHKGVRSAVILEGIGSKQWDEARKGLPSLYSQMNELRLINDSTALLRLADFSSDKKAIGQFIERSFRVIGNNKVKHLIIDVRDNQGGYDRLGSLVYQYLAHEPFSYYDRIEVKAGSVRQLSFRNHASFNKLSGLFGLFIARSGDTYYWTRHRNLHPFKPLKNSYAGKVYFIMNGSSYSVTSELLSAARSSGRAYFIGEESGGAYQGNNSGSFAFVTLPHTKMVFAIPLGGYYMNVSGFDPASGIQPDLAIENGIEDILNKHDKVLERTLELIRQN